MLKVLYPMASFNLNFLISKTQENYTILLSMLQVELNLLLSDWFRKIFTLKMLPFLQTAF